MLSSERSLGLEKYNIKTSKKAKSDIQSNLKYIKYTLKNNTATEKLAKDVDKAIVSLSYMPGRYALIDLGERTYLGVRAMILRKYKIYYFVNDENSTVEILRMLHSRQDEFNELLSDDNIYPKYINEDENEYQADFPGPNFGGMVTRSSADLRSNYSMISELLNIENKHVIITKNGKREAVLVNIDEFERLSNML